MRPLLLVLSLLLLLPGLVGCAAPKPVGFRITDASGDPVAGAHARIILLDAGAPLPVSPKSLEEAAMADTRGRAFSDAAGRFVLPVMGDRDHLIEIEGPVLGAADPREAPVGIWVYRPVSGVLVTGGESESGLRIERVD